MSVWGVFFSSSEGESLELNIALSKNRRHFGFNGLDGENESFKWIWTL